MELPNPKYFIPAVILFMILFYAIALSVCHAQTLTASWYSIDSCKKEGTSGIMANGEKLNDNAYTTASWDYPFGTILEITNLQNGKTIRAKVADRGPNRKLYRRGRVLDLSVAAFKAIADLRAGVIPIEVKEVTDGS